MGHILLHAQLGGTEITLLQVDGVAHVGELVVDVGPQRGQVQTKLHTGILHERLLVGVEALTLLQEG